MLCLVTQSCPTLCDPMDCSLPGTSVHGDSPGPNTGVGSLALLQGNFPNLGIEPRYPALQEDRLPTEPSGKPKSTGVCCLSLPSGNLPNPGVEPRSPALQADSLPAELSGKPLYTIHILFHLSGLIITCQTLTHL